MAKNRRIRTHAPKIPRPEGKKEESTYHKVKRHHKERAEKQAKMRGETKKQEFDSIAYLHGALGNKKVTELHQTGKLMAMLKMSKPGDRYEREADQIASQVMNTNPGTVHENSSAKVAPKVDLSKVNKKKGTTTTTQIKNLSGGEKLDGSTKKFFKSRFDGLDLSKVNIHKSRKANNMAESINARAFTYGNNIVFNKGEYKPNTFQGKKLLAHELAHVAQQTGTQHKKFSRKIKMDDPGKKKVNAGNITDADRMKALENFGKRHKFKKIEVRSQKSEAGSQASIKEETVSKTVAKSSSPSVKSDIIKANQSYSAAPPVKVSSTQGKVVQGWWGKKDDDKEKEEDKEDGKKPKGIGGFAWWAFKNLLGLIGIDVDQFTAILSKAGDALGAIIKDPKGFFGNLGKAVKGGINNFVKNFKKHLMNGIAGWLFGQLGDAGLEMPGSFDFKGILSIILQVIGLTYNNIRGQIIKGLGKGGEEMMSHAEGMFEHLKTAITEGPMALWEQLKEHLAGLKDQFFGMIIDWVKSTVIQQGVMFLISMLNPAGAIVQAVRAIIKIVTFFMERWQQIQDFASSVVDSVSLIAKGDVTAAQNGVENSLAKAMPITISFIAKLVGLGGISKHIKKVIKKIRKPINNAIKKVTGKIAKKIKALPIFKKGKKALDKGKKAVESGKKKLNDAKESVDKAIDDKGKKMRKDIEDGRADKQKKKEDEVKEKNRKGKDAQKDKEALKAEDKKKHKVYAAEIVQKLKADKGNNAKTYKEFHASKVKLAKDLEGRYQKKLKKGINIDITIPPLEKDKKDKDVDFKIKIAPNCVVVEESTDKFKGKLPDFKTELGNVHPAALRTIKIALGKAQEKKEGKEATEWKDILPLIKENDTVKNIMDKPFKVTWTFGQEISKDVGEQAVMDANDKIRETDPNKEGVLGDRSAKSFLEVNKGSIHNEEEPFKATKARANDLLFDKTLEGSARSKLKDEMVKRMEELKGGKHVDPKYRAQEEELSEEEKDKLKLDQKDMDELEADAAKRQNSREVSGKLEGHKDNVKDIQPGLKANALKLDEALDAVLEAAKNIVGILEDYETKVQDEADVAGVNIDLIKGYTDSAKVQQGKAKDLEKDVKAAMTQANKNDPKSDIDKKIDDLKVKVGKIAQELRNISNAVINKTKTYSEKIAEKYTDKAVPQLYDGKADRKYPTSAEDKQGAGDVDRVYIIMKGKKLIVVEVKGGKSQKGSRKVKHDEKLKGTRVEQGTIEYLKDVASEMIDSATKARKEAKKQRDDNDINEEQYEIEIKLLKEKIKTGNDILYAIKNENVDYLLARQDFTKDGKLSTQSITRFKLNWERVNK